MYEADSALIPKLYKDGGMNRRKQRREEESFHFERPVKTMKTFAID